MTTPYATIDEANEYFSGRLNTSAWDEATDADRTKALTMATRAINNLKFIGAMADPTQGNEFPRYGQQAVPDQIKAATCEDALALLDDVDLELEVRNLGSIQNHIGALRTMYDPEFVLAHVRNGIASSEAWALLLPYLVDPLSVKLVR